jgi:hypothetical protein
MLTQTMLPTVAFGDHQITRLISGGNPLCGCSHWSGQRDREMCEYFTDERVVDYLLQVEAAGYNTLQARGDYHRILYWLELARRQGSRLQWIAQTASEMSDVFQNIRIIAAAGAIGIYHHGSATDNFWLSGQIDKVKDYLACMRDCGVRVGLGTHNPEVIAYAEEHDWDVDFYMACFYNIQRKHRQSSLVAPKAAVHAPGGDGPDCGEEFLDDDPAAMCRVIRATPKQCLAFKILGAGRQCATQEQVRAAFAFAYRNIKPTDAVVVGMYPRHAPHIALNRDYALEAMGV